MMANLLPAIAAIFTLAIAGILVERFYRRFAARNPQLGPFRRKADGKCGCCASSASCADSTCRD